MRQVAHHYFSVFSFFNDFISVHSYKSHQRIKKCDIYQQSTHRHNYRRSLGTHVPIFLFKIMYQCLFVYLLFYLYYIMKIKTRHHQRRID